MMQTFTATYDGEKIVPEENVNLSAGQKFIITILDEESMSKEEMLAKNYTDSTSNLFQNTDSIDEYLAKLRKERKLNLEDYMGVGEKMFATTEDIDNYVKDLRSDERF